MMNVSTVERPHTAQMDTQSSSLLLVKSPLCEQTASSYRNADASDVSGKTIPSFDLATFFRQCGNNANLSAILH